MSSPLMFESFLRIDSDSYYLGIIKVNKSECQTALFNLKPNKNNPELGKAGVLNKVEIGVD